MQKEQRLKMCTIKRLSLICSFLSCLIILSSSAAVKDSASQITIYSDVNYGGVRQTINIPEFQCWVLSEFKNIISSVQTYGNCFIVYRKSMCGGEGYKLQPGSVCSSDLTKCNMNDQVASISTC